MKLIDQDLELNLIMEKLNLSDEKLTKILKDLKRLELVEYKTSIVNGIYFNLNVTKKGINYLEKPFFDSINISKAILIAFLTALITFLLEKLF